MRLTQGDYDRQTTYGADPVAAAVAYAEAGARWVHVVDLDAARTGERVNRPVVAAMAAALAGRAALQVGGGVRDRAVADDLVSLGVARVVVGTAAVEDPALVSELVGAGIEVAVGIDARAGAVAVRGWTEGAGMEVGDLVARWEGTGVAALVVTAIERDGMLGGPDVDGLSSLLGATGVPVIASGGVGSLADLSALAGLTGPGGRRLEGAIVGKAIWDGRFGVGEAIAACAR